MPKLILLVALVGLITGAFGTSRTAHASGAFVVARDGNPQATIVIAKDATYVGLFAARELQLHVQKITGAQLPIVRDDAPVTGNRILVGESAATRKLQLKSMSFKEQEYLIRIRPNTVILMGRDKADPAVETETDPPGTYDDQGTCYAVYDFLERFCGVRWFAPGDIGLVCPQKATLAVAGRDVRRSPAFRFRQGTYLPVYGIIKDLWNNPSKADVRLYACRMRLGGQPYAANHSFYGYYDRFYERNPKKPELFETAHPDWFAQGYKGKPDQMAYTNPGFIAQVVQDARDFFDGKGAHPGAQANGDYFALVPMDSGAWDKSPKAQAEMNADQKSNKYFSTGYASDYVFGFANKVAHEIRKSNPDKYLATLAYASYANYPEHTRLESNIAVQLCLHTRNWWAPGMERNDMAIYKSWTTKEKNRPIYVWLYYCFPEERAGKSWRCFPGFFAHTADRQFKMFAKDHIRGVFLNNLGEYLDNYLTLRLMDDPTLNVDHIIDEFHRLYYGAAAEPMKQLYLKIEETYSNPANYPDSIRNSNEHEHQTEELAWKYLGTPERMAKFGKLMDQAEQLASTDIEKQRVALFRHGIWDYMVEGRRLWDAKLAKKAQKAGIGR